MLRQPGKPSIKKSPVRPDTRIHRRPLFSGYFLLILCRPDSLLFLFFFWSAQPSCIFFHKTPCNHNLMTAAQTFQTEVGPYSQDLPFGASAGVRLFQLYNISYPIFH